MSSHVPVSTPPISLQGHERESRMRSSGSDKTFQYVVGFFAAVFLLGIIGTLVLGKKQVDQPTTLAQSSTTVASTPYYCGHNHQRRPSCRSTRLRRVPHPLLAGLRDGPILS